MQGLPNKRPSLVLATQGIDQTAAVLDGSILYLLCAVDAADRETLDYTIRRFDLEHAEGDEREVEPFFTRTGAPMIATFLDLQDQCLLVGGADSLVIDRQSLRIIVSESAMQRPPSWEDHGQFFYYRGQYYRRLSDSDPQSGIDVVDPVAGKVVGHLDCDFDAFFNAQHGLFHSWLPDRWFKLNSVPERRVVLQIDMAQHGLGRVAPGVAFGSSHLYLLAGEWLFLIDLDEFRVIEQLRYVDAPSLRSFRAAGNYDANSVVFAADRVQLNDERLLLTRDSTLGYLAAFDLSDLTDCTWVVPVKSPSCIELAGDLVFGRSSAAPRAWDSCTGEVVWRTRGSGRANRVLVGDGWLVYTSLTGYIECYRWRQPYRSPTRP